jgi:uncharacterized OB-fold protein
MDLERPLPTPLTPEAKPYWDGLKQGKLMVPRCNACGKPFFYPRVACPLCHGRDIGWIEASGRGRLHSFAIAHQSINRAMKVPPPYILAMVQLDEGPRMLTNLVNVPADPAQLRCEMPVRVVFAKQTDDVTIPLWEPVR